MNSENGAHNVKNINDYTGSGNLDGTYITKPPERATRPATHTTRIGDKVPDLWATVLESFELGVYVEMINPSYLPRIGTTDGSRTGYGYRMALPEGLGHHFLFDTVDLILEKLNGAVQREIMDDGETESVSISVTLPLSSTDADEKDVFFGLNITRYDRSLTHELGSLSARLHPGGTASLGKIDDLDRGPMGEMWKLRMVRSAEPMEFMRYLLEPAEQSSAPSGDCHEVNDQHPACAGSFAQSR